MYSSVWKAKYKEKEDGIGPVKSTMSQIEFFFMTEQKSTNFFSDSIGNEGDRLLQNFHFRDHKCKKMLDEKSLKTSSDETAECRNVLKLSWPVLEN